MGGRRDWVQDFQSSLDATVQGTIARVHWELLRLDVLSNLAVESDRLDIPQRQLRVDAEVAEFLAYASQWHQLLRTLSRGRMTSATKNQHPTSTLHRSAAHRP